jgi:uncharacterized coiled-coil protein SlyX
MTKTLRDLQERVEELEGRHTALLHALCTLLPALMYAGTQGRPDQIAILCQVIASTLTDDFEPTEELDLLSRLLLEPALATLAEHDKSARKSQSDLRQLLKRLHCEP